MIHRVFCISVELYRNSLIVTGVALVVSVISNAFYKHSTGDFPSDGPEWLKSAFKFLLSKRPIAMLTNFNNQARPSHLNIHFNYCNSSVSISSDLILGRGAFDREKRGRGIPQYPERRKRLVLENAVYFIRSFIVCMYPRDFIDTFLDFNTLNKCTINLKKKNSFIYLARYNIIYS